jgi:hypothetical protein
LEVFQNFGGGFPRKLEEGSFSEKPPKELSQNTPRELEFFVLALILHAVHMI